MEMYEADQSGNARSEQGVVKAVRRDGDEDEHVGRRGEGGWMGAGILKLYRLCVSYPNRRAVFDMKCRERREQGYNTITYKIPFS